MKENTLTIQINKPVSEVFEFTTNPDNTHKWIDGIEKEVVDEKPIRVGTTYRNKGKGDEWSEYECIEFIPNEKFTLKASDENYHVSYSYRKIDDENAELEYHEWIVDGELDGPFEQPVMEKLKRIMEQETLEIVDENDNVIGLESRVKVHEEGLLHREIHIWFFTPQGEMIFQHRAKDKDTYPDLLDATVGGHVDPGMHYEDTAEKECKEETGVDIKIENLVFLTKMRKKTFDEATGLTNNTIRSQYAYLYEGDIDDLQVEEGKAIGFEAWKLDTLRTLDEDKRTRFIPAILSEEFLSLFDRGWSLLSGRNSK